MAKCTFENLTPEQAKILAEWYEGQGEQTSSEWFEESGIKSPLTDVTRPGGYKEVAENGDVTVFCK